MCRLSDVVGKTWNSGKKSPAWEALPVTWTTEDDLTFVRENMKRWV